MAINPTFIAHGCPTEGNTSDTTHRESPSHVLNYPSRWNPNGMEEDKEEDIPTSHQQELMVASSL